MATRSAEGAELVDSASATACQLAQVLEVGMHSCFLGWHQRQLLPPLVILQGVCQEQLILSQLQRLEHQGQQAAVLQRLCSSALLSAAPLLQACQQAGE